MLAEKQKKNVKKVLLIIALVILVLLVIVGVIVYRFFDRYVLFTAQNFKEEYPIVSTAFTDEQKLADLEELYQIAFLGNLTIEEREALFGFDYDALYHEYQKKIVDTDNEFEYYVVLSDFISYVGSGHTCMSFPHYIDNVNSGFELSYDCLNSTKAASRIYSFEQKLKEQCETYESQYAIMRYENGFFVMGNYDSSYWGDDLSGGVIIAINDVTVEDFLRDHPGIFPYEYDDINRRLFRSKVIFNSTSGDPVSLQISFPDGTLKTIDAYYDSSYEVARLLQAYYGKHSTQTDVVKLTNQYELYTDDTLGIAYVNIASCSLYQEEIQRLEQDIVETIPNYNNIILDLRENGGGSVVLLPERVYPYLFEDNLSRIRNIKLVKNDVTAEYAKNMFNHFDGNFHYNKADYCYYFETEDTYIGKAEETKQIYILVSEKTFSAADTFASDLQGLSNVTIIGSHSGGEGIEGDIFNYTLPNSGLLYSFTPTINVNTEGENALTGITPDVVVYADPFDYYEVCYRKEHDLDYQSLEARMTYDNAVIEAVKLIKEK